MTLSFRYDDVDAVDHPLHARFAAITLGSPGRCPECDAFGYIDKADLAGHFQSQHCRGCGYRWEYSFDAAGRIQEVRELPASYRRPGRTVTGVSHDADAVVDLRSAGEPAPRRRARWRTPASRG